MPIYGQEQERVNDCSGVSILIANQTKLEQVFQLIGPVVELKTITPIWIWDLAWWWGVGQLLKCQAQAIKSQPQVTVDTKYFWYLVQFKRTPIPTLQHP